MEIFEKILFEKIPQLLKKQISEGKRRFVKIREMNYNVMNDLSKLAQPLL